MFVPREKARELSGLFILAALESDRLNFKPFNKASGLIGRFAADGYTNAESCLEDFQHWCERAVLDETDHTTAEKFLAKIKRDTWPNQAELSTIENIYYL